MPISKTNIVKSIMSICSKHDPKGKKGTTYKSLKKIYGVESLSQLMRNEINGWTKGSVMIMKHQRIEGLKTFFKGRDGAENEKLPFPKILEDVADFIVYKQIQEEKSAKKISK